MPLIYLYCKSPVQRPSGCCACTGRQPEHGSKKLWDWKRRSFEVHMLWTDQLWNANIKIIDLAVKMDEDNVPTANRWLVISPEIYGQLIKEVPTISKGENTLGINQSYFIGSWGGFTIYKSNNVQRTAKKYHCMAGVSAGLTLAMQINKMEAAKVH